VTSAGLIRPATDLATVRVDQREHQHDHVIQHGSQFAGYQLLGDQLRSLFRRDLAAVYRRCNQDNGLSGSEGILRIGDGGLGDGDEEHLPVEQRPRQRLHAHQVTHLVEVVPKLHQRHERRRTHTEVVLLLIGLRELLRGEAAACSDEQRQCHRDECEVESS
jgi:hypothetical protein